MNHLFVSNFKAVQLKYAAGGAERRIMSLCTMLICQNMQNSAVTFPKGGKYHRKCSSKCALNCRSFYQAAS